MDGDEQLGQPIVSNGLPLTKIHHAAFDAHLIGIVSAGAKIPH
jgi:putative restriction endonuclease